MTVKELLLAGSLIANVVVPITYEAVDVDPLYKTAVQTVAMDTKADVLKVEYTDKDGKTRIEYPDPNSAIVVNEGEVAKASSEPILYQAVRENNLNGVQELVLGDTLFASCWIKHKDGKVDTAKVFATGASEIYGEMSYNYCVKVDIVPKNGTSAVSVDAGTATEPIETIPDGTK